MRVTNTLIFNSAIANLQKQSARLFEAQQQVAAGKTIRRPSDDPVGARRILDLRNTLSSMDQFKKNRKTINSLLQSAETGLQSMETLILRARSITLRAANATVNPDNRTVMATEVADLFEQALQIGNMSVNGHFLFAGQADRSMPFSAMATSTSTASGLTTSGTLTPLASADLIINGTQIRAPRAADDTVSTSDNTASALAIAAAINDAASTTGVQAHASTALSLTIVGFGDLVGNNLRINGVAITGTITDEASLVAAINAAHVPGVVASSTGSGNLTLTAADGRNIQLQTDGLALGDMAFVGFDLGGGTALDKTTTGTVTLSSRSPFTLGGLNPGNAGFRAGHVNLTAQYSGDTRELRMAMNTAQTIPVTIPGSQFLVADLHPHIDRHTPLASLRQGRGISAGAIQITDRAGNTAVVDLSSAITIGDVIDAISTAAGINVTAAINARGDGLTVTDDNAVPTRNLTITEVGAGTTASELGLALDRPGALVGTPLNPRLTPTTPLSLLHDGKGVTLTSLHIANGAAEADVDLSTAQTIGDVLTAINASGADVTARINASGTALEVRSNDATTVAIVTEVDGGTTAADLGIQGGRGILTTLSLLQEALQKNDQQALQHLLTSLDEGFQQVETLRADVGVRMNRVEFVESNLQELELNMRTLLASTEEGDAIEMFSRLSNLTVSFQAALAATAQTVQPTLLDFLR
jgi:flagellin-like hook-associated protein FlgL